MDASGPWRAPKDTAQFEASVLTFPELAVGSAKCRYPGAPSGLLWLERAKSKGLWSVDERAELSVPFPCLRSLSSQPEGHRQEPSLLPRTNCTCQEKWKVLEAASQGGHDKALPHPVPSDVLLGWFWSKGAELWIKALKKPSLSLGCEAKAGAEPTFLASRLPGSLLGSAPNGTVLCHLASISPIESDEELVPPERSTAGKRSLPDCS